MSLKARTYATNIQTIHQRYGLPALYSVVQNELELAGLIPVKIGLGEVTIITSKGPLETNLIEGRLRPLGFELLEDKKMKTVREIRELVAEVYSGNYDFPNQFRFSDLVASRIHKDYNAVSAMFTQMEQKTLERYIIDYRIEKVKEFLLYTSLTLADIAFKLNFSSVAHLSRQFKQYTGFTPSGFKDVRLKIEFSDN